MSNIFDKYCLKKENGVRRRIEIDNSLYDQLSFLANNLYDASINKLVNIAIIELIATSNVTVYEKKVDEFSEAHNFLIKESSYRGLEELKKKYGLSIYKLVNIAIYNSLND